jgi:hypothetical protein
MGKVRDFSANIHRISRAKQNGEVKIQLRAESIARANGAVVGITGFDRSALKIADLDDDHVGATGPVLKVCCESTRDCVVLAGVRHALANVLDCEHDFLREGKNLLPPIHNLGRGAIFGARAR